MMLKPTGLRLTFEGLQPKGLITGKDWVQCAELSEKLAEDMASEGLRGKTLTLKLKETNFEVRTRNITLTRHISSREDIMREALKLLRAEMPITIRLMVSLGVRHILGSSSSQDPLAGCGG